MQMYTKTFSFFMAGAKITKPKVAPKYAILNDYTYYTVF